MVPKSIILSIRAISIIQVTIVFFADYIIASKLQTIDAIVRSEVLQGVISHPEVQQLQHGVDGIQTIMSAMVLIGFGWTIAAFFVVEKFVKKLAHSDYTETPRNTDPQGEGMAPAEERKPYKG